MRLYTTRRLLTAVLSIPLTLTIAGCGGEDDSSDTPAPAAITTGYVDLSAATPRTQNIDFDYSGAGFDPAHSSPPHWQITSAGGYMSFRYSGKFTFRYHAMGSAPMGASYCFITVTVNGKAYTTGHFMTATWGDYMVPSSYLSEGMNLVTIQLIAVPGYVTSTPLWIDGARFD